jgi:hypothetical protein
VKRRRALLESNPPGNSCRKLIKTMIPEAGFKALPPVQARHHIGLIVRHVRAPHKG